MKIRWYYKWLNWLACDNGLIIIIFYHMPSYQHQHASSLMMCSGHHVHQIVVRIELMNNKNNDNHNNNTINWYRWWRWCTKFIPQTYPLVRCHGPVNAGNKLDIVHPFIISQLQYWFCVWWPQRSIVYPSIVLCVFVCRICSSMFKIL